MKNDKKNVHTSGAIGMLLKQGAISRIQDINEDTKLEVIKEKNSDKKDSFITNGGIPFSEEELTYLNPEECEPWKYANRMHDELTNLDELIESIQNNGQLQPALVRPHPLPHGEIKFEVIFGRRRHLACLKLGKPFLVIKKECRDVKEAIAFQDAENKQRKNVSNYSNSILYARLLQDKVFATDRELAEKLAISKASMSELLSFSKIPTEIIRQLRDVHTLSTAMAVKIVSLLNKSVENYSKILFLAPHIGNKIDTPLKLENAVENAKNENINPIDEKSFQVFVNQQGKKLFTSRIDHRGNFCIQINKEFTSIIQKNDLCDRFKNMLEEEIFKSAEKFDL